MATKITFHAPPHNQGQIVEVSYATTGDGLVIMHRYDRSDRSSSYEVSKILAADRGDYWQSEPRNKRWRPMTSDEIRAYGIND